MLEKIKLRPTLTCPCGEKNLKTEFFYSKRPKGETKFEIGNKKYYRYYESCTLCNHWFGKCNIDVNHFYKKDYSKATYGNILDINKTFNKIINLPYSKSDNKHRVKRVISFYNKNFNFVKKKRALIDFGSGIGVFPFSMKHLGWNVTSIEKGIHFHSHLKNFLKIKSFKSNLENLKKELKKKYDLLTFVKVLEHVLKPKDLLNQTKIYLKKKGIIYIEVPSISAQKKGKDREEFYIEHLHVFSKNSIKKLLLNCGFKILKLSDIVESSGKYTIYVFAKLDRLQNIRKFK